MEQLMTSGGGKGGGAKGGIRSGGTVQGAASGGAKYGILKFVRFWRWKCEQQFSFWQLQLINLSTIASRNYTPNLAYCSQSTLMPSL